MKKILVMLMASTIAVSAGYSFAQSDDGIEEDAVVETGRDNNDDRDRRGRFNREPVDLESFSRMEELTEADSDGDGTLSREELEDAALARIVKRAADRMERRLDINGDGTVTLSEIEDYRARQFAALDRDGNGTLERREMRQMKQFRAGGPRHSHRGSQRFHHGPRH